MTDPKLESEARELLAAEYDKVDPYTAKLIREGGQLHSPAIRAIVAALSQRDALVAEYERACGIKGEGYVHALMHIFNAITNAHIDAKVAALSQQRTVPDGWVLVPREARLSMLEAMSIALYEDVRLISARERFRAAYAAMLAAAPQPPSGGDSIGCDYVPGRLDHTAPPRIWLQIDNTGSNDERGDEWPGPDHVTWQDESIGGLEIEYVRADLTAPPSAPVGDELVQTALRNLPQYIGKSGLVGPDKHSALLCVETLREALAQQPAAVDGAMAGWIADGDTIPASLIEATRDAIRLEFGNNGTDGYYKRILVRVFTALAAQPGGSDNDR